jgi:hypothetical protein
MQKETKSRLNSGNACYYSVESSHLLSRNEKVKICKTTVLPVALHGCETWSLTLREVHRLKVFENRRIFGPNRHTITGEWSKLHNEELHIFHLPPSIIRQMKAMGWARDTHVSVKRIEQGFGGKVRRKETSWKTWA